MRNNVPTAPLVFGASGPPQRGSTGASSTRGATGIAATGKNNQNIAVAPTGATGVTLSTLQDSGYLNTSNPKNFPIIDQPGGKYKPLSEVSRFVFDSAQVNSSYEITPEFELEFKNSTGSSGGYTNSNRKYFGANLAVLRKLEDVEFKSGENGSDKKSPYEKRDYIAYLIPYGTPGVASNSTKTISTQIPASDREAQGAGSGVAAPNSNAQKLKKKYPAGYELFFSSSFVVRWNQVPASEIDTPEKKKVKYEEIKKQVESSWDATINSLPSESEILNINLIIEGIKSVYIEPNYSQYVPLLRELNLKITDNASFEIQKLKENLESIKAPRSLSTIETPPPGNGIDILPPPSPVLAPKTTVVTGRCADPNCGEGNQQDPGISGVDPSLKIWQFLYNPQSITIDVRADYAESNTWGATDDGQSGQSVIWQRNKNPVMRLDEVVLNGFIHGKKVSQLEEGLFALLMSRDGPGQIEPTVWEFVWGRRRFGPCIINDIQVVEKQWEAGEVLTATVSFTLTQIPKWQIVDSTVKFYDPTAIGTFAAPPSPQETGATGAPSTPSGKTDAEQKANAPGGGGQGDPCRASFNGIIDGARSKSISNYLFKCSKLTNPSIDLYKDTTPRSKEEKVDDLITSILDKLDKQCNSFNGGKTFIISTQREGEEYKKQGFAVLKEAVKERERCVNQSKLRGKSVSPAQVKDLLKNAYEGSKFDSFSFGLSYDPNKFTNYYESVYNRVSNYFSIDDLAKRIDINSFIIFSKVDGKWNSNPRDRKCKIKTIRDKYFSNKDSLLKETRICHQQIWLVILQEMSKKNIVFDSSVSKNFTNTDIFIELFLSKNIPKEILVKSGGLFFSNQKRFLLPSLDLK